MDSRQVRRKLIEQENTWFYKFRTYLSELIKKPGLVVFIPLQILRAIVWEIKKIRVWLNLLRTPKEGAERKQEVSSSEIKPVYPGLRIAVILDEFSYQCFTYEADLLRITPGNFEAEIEAFKPHLLLVESSWHGNNDTWYLHVVHCSKQVKDLINYCNMQEIPTVFWNKEDPPHFHEFKKTAGLFDHIFTTCMEFIDKYQEETGARSVNCLMFAAQPKLHNPIIEKELNVDSRKIMFGGTFYTQKYPKRRVYIQELLDAAMKWDLDIFDRQNFRKFNPDRYPQKYQLFIKPSQRYDEFVKTQKKYRVILNVNSEENSESMFSRRIFECLASRQIILSSPNRGIEKYFGDVVYTAGTKKEAEAHLNAIFHHFDVIDRNLQKGMRRVLSLHTYTQRIQQICQTVGIFINDKKRSVSVLSVCENEEQVNRVLACYRSQTYQQRELILVLGKNIKEKIVRTSEDKSVIFTKVELERSFGDYIFTSMEMAKYDTIALFEPDCIYGPDYLLDMMLSFLFTDAEIIGKSSFFKYDTERRTILLTNPDNSFRHVKDVPFSTWVIQRESLAKLSVQGKEKTEISAAGKMKIFSSDQYNFLEKFDKKLLETDRELIERIVFV